jgi:hypothetical protein
MKKIVEERKREHTEGRSSIISFGKYEESEDSRQKHTSIPPINYKE